MQKNITVIDENGNIIGSTYPKRAKGLIRKGRAQRDGDNAIIMRAADKESEEKIMALNIYEIFDNQVSKLQEQLRNEEPETSAPVRMQILKTIETFRRAEQSEKICELIKTQLEIMQESLKAETAPEGAVARETTRQNMLSLMEKLLHAENEKPELPEAPNPVYI